MKICLASLHPRRLSGQVESVVSLSRALRANGHEVQLVTAFEENVPGAAVPSTKSELGASALGKLLCLARGIARIAAASRDADIIQVNLPTPAFSMLADCLALWTGGRVPIVVGYEAHLADVRQLIRDDYLRRDLRFYLPRLLINNGIAGRFAAYHCQRYVIASQWQRRELLALGVPEKNLVVIPNLIDTQKLRTVSREVARKSLPGSDSTICLIGWAGHFHHVKGLDVLLDAFAPLSHLRPELRLALAWSGIGNRSGFTAQVRRLGIANKIIRLGRIDVGCFISALDALALPYRLTIGQGAFPNLVMEAMSVGVPLVTSDLPLLRELAGNHNAALFARPGDPESLRAALTRLLDDVDLSAEIVLEQRRLMDGAFALEPLVRRYLTMYEDVLAEHREAGMYLRT